MPSAEPGSPPPSCSPSAACCWGRACCSAARRSGSACRSRSLFLLVGMLAGSEGIGGIAFDDYRLRLPARARWRWRSSCSTAGSTRRSRRVRRRGRRPACSRRRAWRSPALLIAVPAHLWGLAWPQALLLGAVVSSTDAAAVFAVLRGSGLQLKRRVGVDARAGVGPQRPRRRHPHHGAHRQPAAPGRMHAPGGWRWTWCCSSRSARALGLGHRNGGRHLLRRLPARHAAASIPPSRWRWRCWRSGWRRCCTGAGSSRCTWPGCMLGNGPLPYRTGLLRVHDALAWLAQIGMFLVLGLLVFPSGWSRWRGRDWGWRCCWRSWCGRWWWGSACSRSAIRGGRSLYIGWVGLRGAVPIVLATYPVLVGGGGGGADLPPRLLHRGGRTRWCRAATVALGDAAAGAADGGAAGAAGGARDRVAAAARGGAAVVLHR